MSSNDAGDLLDFAKELETETCWTEESSCIRSARKDRPLSRCWPNLKRRPANIAARRPNEIDEIAAVGIEKKSRNREMSRIPGAPAYVYTDMGDHITPAGGFDARYV